MSRFLRAAVDSRLAYALEQVERFEAFHAANARLFIKSFVDTFTQDDVLARVLEGLRRHLALAPADWHSQVTDMELPPLPDSAPAAMAFRFAVFRYARRQKVDLRHFVSNHFPGEHLNERLMGWKRLFVHPFAADLHLLVERLPRHFEAGEWVDLDAALAACLSEDIAREGFGPRAWTDADDEAWEATQRPAGAAPAPAPTPAQTPAPDDAAQVLAELRSVLAHAELDADARADLDLDLEALGLELERPTLARERFLARLESVEAACAATREPAAALRALLP